MTRLLPPHSYINVHDFPSIERFAEFIIKVLYRSNNRDLLLIRIGWW
jgi:hypothetical protein